jgi:hypothetical protein
MEAVPCLDAGLFIGGDYKFILFERLSFPLTLVEIQNPGRLGGKVRVAWENPTPMLPRPNRIFMQPAPKRGLTQLSDQTTVANMPGQLVQTPAGEPYVIGGGQFASTGFSTGLCGGQEERY